MARVSLFFMLFLISLLVQAQQSERTSTIDFVEILNGNISETEYYYQNNWKILREMAVKRGHIVSYEIIETAPTSEAPFHLMLITTYATKAQYKQREKHFQALIKEKGNLELLNDKKPSEFRKTLFSKEKATHWSH